MKTKLKQNQTAPVFLMAEPDFLSIEKPFEDGHAPANEFAIAGYEAYAKDPEAFVAKAKKQWTQLKDVFNAIGAETVVIKPDPANPDQAFTADPSVSLKQADGSLVTVFSKFSNAQRQPEVAAHVALLEKEEGRTLADAHFNMEGVGDNVYDPYRDVFWSGYTETPGREGASHGRTDKRAHAALAAMTGVEVISLETQKPFFHIDTALAPLPSGHVLCFKGGMTDEAFEKMQQEAFDKFNLPREEYLIEVSEEDAAGLACNLRYVGNTVVMAECSKALQNKLESIGYEVITVDVSQFIHAGGAVHCLTNPIYEPRIPGGYAKKPGGCQP
jgi:N-dimethylarginine dimethylaminohydrolase